MGRVRMPFVTPSRNVSVDDVRDHFDRVPKLQGNPRVKLGAIKDADKDMIGAEIVTSEGSLVDRLSVKRWSGVIQRTE